MVRFAPSRKIEDRAEGVNRLLRGSGANVVSRPLTRLAVLMVLLTTGCRFLPTRTSPTVDLASARQLTQRGLTDLREGRCDDAESHFSESIRVYPTDPLSRRLYAEALWNRGEQEAALEQMRAATELSGGVDVPLLVRLGEMYRERGQLTLAAHQAREAIRLATDHAPAWILQARVKRQNGDIAGALADSHRALSYDPNNLAVRLDVAALHLQANRPHRSLAVLHAIVDQQGGGDLPLEALALEASSQQKLGRHAEAIETFAELRRRGGATAETMMSTAESYLALRQLEGAEWALREAEQRSDPSDGWLHDLHRRLAASRTTDTIVR